MYCYIVPWGGTLASVAWAIRAYYHYTLGFPPGQAVFGRDILFNLTSIVDWSVVTARKQWKVDIDHVQKTARQVRHDY